MSATALLLAVGVPHAPLIELNCNLEPNRSSMHVAATVTYEPAQAATDRAVFFLGDAMTQPKVRIIEPSRLAGDCVAKPGQTDNHSITYEIGLRNQLKAGERLKVSFEYENATTKGFVYSLSDKECLAGGYNTCWFPSVGDSRRMLGQLEFDTPAGYLVKASGKETAATEKDGRRLTHFEIGQPIVPTFAAARFKVVRVSGVVPMTLYLLHERPSSQAFADGCSRVLGVLSHEFGPYPFPDFSIIETPSPKSSRDMGFTGASFEGFMFADSNNIDSGFNLAYYGHEMGHQWWGNLVQLAGNRGSYMLSEAMAQYGSLQCVREIEGREMAARYRFSGYPGYSDRQCGLGAILYSATDADRPLSQLPAGYDVVYHQYANSKGFLAWDTIARQIGRDHFRQALHAVTSKYAWGTVTFDQFLEEIQTASPGNVRPILDQWLDRKGFPVLTCQWHQTGNRLEVKVTQSEPVYTLRMPVAIEFEDGTRIVREIDCSALDSATLLEVRAKARSVVLDPDFEVLHATPALIAQAKDLRFATEALFARMRGDDKAAEAVCQAGLAALPVPDTNGAEFFLRSSLGEIYRSAGKWAEAKAELDRAVGCAVRKPAVLPWVFLRLALVNRALGDERAAQAAAMQAAAADAAVEGGTGVASELAKFNQR